VKGEAQSGNAFAAPTWGPSPISEGAFCARKRASDLTFARRPITRDKRAKAPDTSLRATFPWMRLALSLPRQRELFTHIATRAPSKCPEAVAECRVSSVECRVPSAVKPLPRLSFDRAESRSTAASSQTTDKLMMLAYSTFLPLLSRASYNFKLSCNSRGGDVEALRSSAFPLDLRP
jgi:hypothetical protein